MLAKSARSASETPNLTLLNFLPYQVVEVEVSFAAGTRTKLSLGTSHLALLHIAHLRGGLDSRFLLVLSLRLSLGSRQSDGLRAGVN